MKIEIDKVAEVKLVYKTKVKAADRLEVKNSQSAYDILRALWDNETIEHHESVYLLLLNRAHKVLGVRQLSTGGTSGTVMDAKMIFQYCLNANASSFILSHNHPSGNTNPSEADINITKKIKEGSKLLDINFLDHLIITPEDRYSSMADEGLF